MADINGTLLKLLEEAKPVLQGQSVTGSITGSAGANAASTLGFSYIQEVLACSCAVEKLIPKADVVVELGGEDAKVSWFKDGLFDHGVMNSVCAGGTGAFIDSMASLLKVSTMELNELAMNYKQLYPIASRCGVFAKTDIQPMLNEGAAREDVAASIFQAVVNQTIGGLAAGKPIRGNVAFLGGPLHFLPALRNLFIKTLNLDNSSSIVPANGHYFVAIGAALSSGERLTDVDGKEQAQIVLEAEELYRKLENINDSMKSNKKDEFSMKMSLPPLFKDESEYEEFVEKHKKHDVAFKNIDECSGDLFLGIDAGSTTTKTVLMDKEGNIVYQRYGPNNGNPLQSVLDDIKDVYSKIDTVNSSKGETDKIRVAFSGCTGYGESLVKASLHIDIGEVETVAHYTAACEICDGAVDFVMDIGGVDMKCIFTDIKSKTQPKHKRRLQTLEFKGKPEKDECEESFQDTTQQQGKKDGKDEAGQHCIPDLEDVIQEKAIESPERRTTFEQPISNVVLNESCSSGCGSFLSQFAANMSYSISDFSKLGILDKHPYDLGSRCTIFMNSCVKQAQKEGASINSISAGLSISVVKNALYKVLRLNDNNMRLLGDVVVCQGGTFLNDAVLRAFELLTGKNVIRPNIAGLMGAYGSAIIARDRFYDMRNDKGETPSSSFLKKEDVESFAWTTKTARCGQCGNNCLLTISIFPDKTRHISGNRCERGAGAARRNMDLPNIYAYKLKTLFGEKSKYRCTLEKDEQYKTLEEKYPRGLFLIPRALNVYEDFPFYFTLLTQLGFEVQTSGQTSKRTARAGQEYVASDTVCYPAKLAVGHVKELIGAKLRKKARNNNEYSRGIIFYPMVPMCREDRNSSGPIKFEDHARNVPFYNCPVVGLYPESISCCMEGLEINPDRRKNWPVIEKAPKGKPEWPAVKMWSPVLPLDTPKRFISRFWDELIKLFPDVTKKEVKQAVRAAYDELAEYKARLGREGEKALSYLASHPGTRGIVLAGRPYHIDGEINHGIPELITSYGLAVLSEDSVFKKAQDLPSSYLPNAIPLRVRNQWTFHNRMYQAARLVASNPSLQLVQLVSFGCGLDAITTDQIKEILDTTGKIYTGLKIDEMSNLGSVRIRVRSLLAALDARDKARGPETLSPYGLVVAQGTAPSERREFTKAMKDSGEYTILSPAMSDHHFQFFGPALKRFGYDLRVMENIDGDSLVKEGLTYIHSDVCYPCILTLGQMIDYVKKQGLDKSPDRLAMVLTQTGGGCRATNYIALLRKAFIDAGVPQIPVISLSLQNIEPNSGFNFGVKEIKALFYCIMIGDTLMSCVSRVRPYERVKGSADIMYGKVCDKLKEEIATSGKLTYKLTKSLSGFVAAEFDKLPLVDGFDTYNKRPRVGIVGEILVKYDPRGNRNIVRFIESQGCESETPPLLDFFLYCLYDQIVRRDMLTGTKTAKTGSRLAIKILERVRDSFRKILARHPKFYPIHSFYETVECGREITTLAADCGEGWLLPAEMVSLIRHGCSGVILLSPFGCLPNHIIGKALIERVRQEVSSDAVLASVDFDVTTSDTNSMSRVKLLCDACKRRMRMASGKAAKAVAHEPMDGLLGDMAEDIPPETPNTDSCVMTPTTQACSGAVSDF